MSMKYDVKVGKFLDNKPPAVAPQTQEDKYFNRANYILDGVDAAMNASTQTSVDSISMFGKSNGSYNTSVVDKANSLL